jgi:hypothetical protein
MPSEAGRLIILIELSISIPLDSPFASRLVAFRPLSLQSASPMAEPAIRFSTISVERCVQKVPSTHTTDTRVLRLTHEMLAVY